MSYNVFPVLQGVTWNLVKRPMWNVSKMTTAARNEFRTGYGLYPITEFDLSYSYMSLADKLTMEGFFNQQAGSLTPFYFDAQNDDTQSTLLTFGTITAGQHDYPILKNSGTGAIEPVGGLNGAPSLWVNGVSAPLGGLNPPPLAVLSQIAGGTMAATTYYVVCTWSNAWGETHVSFAEASLAVSADFLLQVAQPANAPPQALSWNVYASASSGSETLQTTATNIPMSTNTWTMPTSGLAGTQLPHVNYTSWSLDASNTGIWIAPPIVTGLPLAWTGQYYYLVRFKEDVLEFNQLSDLVYELRQCVLTVVR